MADPDTEEETSDPPDRMGELEWTARRFGHMYKFWTIPVISVSLKRYSKESRASTKATALAAVIVLLFVIRPDFASSGIKSALISATITGALAFGINFVSTAFDLEIDDRTIISGYTSVVLIMAVFIFVKLFEGMPPEIINFDDDLIDASYKEDIRDVMWASGFVMCLLILKARFLDKNKPGMGSLVFGIFVVLVSALLVFFVAVVPANYLTTIITG